MLHGSVDCSSSEWRAACMRLAARWRSNAAQMRWRLLCCAVLRACFAWQGVACVSRLHESLQAGSTHLRAAEGQPVTSAVIECNALQSKTRTGGAQGCLRPHATPAGRAAMVAGTRRPGVFHKCSSCCLLARTLDAAKRNPTRSAQRLYSTPAALAPAHCCIACSCILQGSGWGCDAQPSAAAAAGLLQQATADGVCVFASCIADDVPARRACARFSRGACCELRLTMDSHFVC